MSDLRKKQLNEAVKRMRELNILPQTISEFEKESVINKSEYNGILYWLDTEEKELVECFEKEYNSLVYHVIKGSYRLCDGSVMNCIDMLYVSAYEEEWQRDFDELKCGETLSYNITDGCKEFGFIMVNPINGGVSRVA